MSSQIQRTLYLEKQESGVLLQPGYLVQPALQLKERAALATELKILPFGGGVGERWTGSLGLADANY